MDQKKKRVYYMHGELQVHPVVQTEFPIVQMTFPGIKGFKRYTPAFQELIFWYYFAN